MAGTIPLEPRFPSPRAVMDLATIQSLFQMAMNSHSQAYKATQTVNLLNELPPKIKKPNPIVF